MIKRLQWLYPPTAHKFFLNLMGITCDRLQNLTECFSEIKMQDDSAELCNRLNFYKILDTEIQRSQSCCTNLSLCLVKLNFEDSAVGSDHLIKDRIFHSLGEFFFEEIRNWDTLHRYEQQTYALLMPQTSFDEAQDFCNRLKRISEKNYPEIDGVRLKLDFGLAELTPGKDETGAELLAKATSVLQNIGSQLGSAGGELKIED